IIAAVARPGAGHLIADEVEFCKVALRNRAGERRMASVHAGIEMSNPYALAVISLLPKRRDVEPLDAPGEFCRGLGLDHRDRCNQAWRRRRIDGLHASKARSSSSHTPGRESDFALAFNASIDADACEGAASCQIAIVCTQFEAILPEDVIAIYKASGSNKP